VERGACAGVFNAPLHQLRWKALCAFSNAAILNNVVMFNLPAWTAFCRLDAAIKSVLDELGDNEERRAAFLRLLACVRSCTQSDVVAAF